MCDNDDAVADLNASARDTIVNNDTISGIFPMIRTRWDNVMEEHEDIFYEPGQLTQCSIDQSIDL